MLQTSLVIFKAKILSVKFVLESLFPSFLSTSHVLLGLRLAGLGFVFKTSGVFLSLKHLSPNFLTSSEKTQFTK